MGRVEEHRITSRDGVALEAELLAVEGADTAAVLCHPHPQYGGSMRSGLMGDLFRGLPAAGITCVRFNFRGVERSEGAWDNGDSERGDVAAAVDWLADLVAGSVPIWLVGWSFGADMALSTRDSRVAGWCVIAPPLHFAADLDQVGDDPRPKHFVLGERDEIVSVDRIRDVTGPWRATTVEVIPGASHFFVGKSDAVVAVVAARCRPGQAS